jgi:hypothetical protein
MRPNNIPTIKMATKANRTSMSDEEGWMEQVEEKSRPTVFRAAEFQIYHT